MNTRTNRTARSKKATFNLHTDVLAALDEAVAGGSGESKNAVVERAILREIKEIQRQARRGEWERAKKDPLFLRDLDRTEKDFYHADAEGLGSDGAPVDTLRG